MRTQRLLGIAAIGLLSVSCGKLRGLAGQVKRSAETKAAATIDASKSAGTTPDPVLQALVDQTPEGAVFRKDLPFPEQLQVKVERRFTFNSARVLVKSAIGNQSAVLSGTRYFTTVYARTGERVALTMESAGFSLPVAGKAAAAVAAPVVPEPPVELTRSKDLAGGTISLTRHGKRWQAQHVSDFKFAAWGSELEPSMGALCMDAGVLPRAYWFGPRRLKPGETVPLAGAALALLLGEGASGALGLKLESFEASGGHPCGVFSVTGDYHAAGVPGPDGEVFDQEVSISSGKVWLSLVYPVVIREQLETVQTLVSGARSSHSIRIQGAVSVAVTREWQQTPAAAK
ncbi:MAG: hypothetical protein NTW21_38950 [Verrucomicrobia bacterium]|nr:hypothetical protein [Verrucomicrobiota bacterium]